MKIALRIGGLILSALLAILLFGPRETFDRGAGFDAATLPADLDAYLAAEEAAVPGMTPGAEKEIVWVGAKGEATALSLVYLHGFSASKEEIRPLPDVMADALGANLYYARFTGHGRDGAALAAASAGDWHRDALEALEIGRRIGERVIVIGTSTGATMATIALADQEAARGVAGFIAVSPNYRPKGAPLALLTAPLARQLLPLAFGEERSWEPLNDGQAEWWTTRYPLTAVLPMAAAVEEARSVEAEGIATPALFIFAEADQVVDHAATREIAARWGGPVSLERIELGPNDDPFAHVIAGDILSPDQTAPIAAILLSWIEIIR
ncbi:MAG: alpha/beta fold hydrolase [Pseudomonadota bacterium]